MADVPPIEGLAPAWDDFNYLVEAEAPDQVLELRLLCAFVALEGLKHSYAKASNIPFVKGRFRDQKGKPLSFEALLKDMMDSVKMRRGVRRIIDLRNDLFRSSISELSVDSQWKRFEAAMEVSQEYLLRLLGYKGYYRAYGMAVRRLT